MLDHLIRWLDSNHLNPKRLKPWIIPLEKLNRADLVRAGAKAVTLGGMLRAGLPVPPGFVLTTALFERFLSGATEWPQIQRALNNLGPNGFAEAEALSQRAR